MEGQENTEERRETKGKRVRDKNKRSTRSSQRRNTERRSLFAANPMTAFREQLRGEIHLMREMRRGGPEPGQDCRSQEAAKKTGGERGEIKEEQICLARFRPKRWENIGRSEASLTARLKLTGVGRVLSGEQLDNN